MAIRLPAGAMLIQPSSVRVWIVSGPKDFAWNELVRMLNAFGYSEVPTGKTGGSRQQFRCDGRRTIDLHKPHPGNIVKTYACDAVRRKLEEEGLI